MLLSEQIWMAQAMNGLPDAVALLDEAELHAQVRVYAQVARELAAQGLLRPDPEMFYALLEERDRAKLDEAGYGLDWLRAAKNIELTPDRLKFANHALRDAYLRTLIKQGTDKINKELALAESAEEVSSLLTQIAARVQRVSVGESEIIYPQDMAALTIALLEEQHRRGGGMKTGIPFFDDWVGDGFDLGQLVTIGAWSGHNKSVLSHALAQLLALNSGTYAYFQDVELGQLTAMQRFTLRETQQNFFSPDYDEKTAMRMVANMAERLDAGRMILGLPQRTTLERVETLSRTAIQTSGAKIVVWDGAHVLKVAGAESLTAAALEVTRRAKQFARENNVLLVLTGQLLQSRAPQAGLPRRPEREDFKQTAGFIEDADHSFIIRRVDKKPCMGDIEEYGDGHSLESAKARKGLLEVLYAKQRGGDKEGQRETLNLNPRNLRFKEEPRW